MKKDNDLDTIKLYNTEIPFAENFKDGINTKYILVPIYKDGKEGEDFTPLLNAGAKVIMNKKYQLNDYSEQFNYLALDYDSIFGLRLLTFQKYNSTTFKCDERVFFETLIIKFRRFGYIKFFWSYTTIKDELGISVDRAHSIIKKFVKMGFLTTKISTNKVNGRPSQITYFDIDVVKILELVPKIYKKKFHENMSEGISEYLKVALENTQKNSSTTDTHISNIIQE
jgi:hypothetical protein